MTALALELTRSLRWSLLMVGVLMPVTAAVLVRAALAPERTPAAASTSVARLVCESTRLDAEPCPATLHCIAGTCEPLRREVRRGEGEACGETLCTPGLECFRGACTLPEDLPVVAVKCRPPAVRAAVAYLRSQCAARIGVPGASLRDCTEETWLRFSETDPQFEAQLGALPGVFSLHFERDQPDLEMRWVTPEVRAAYREQVAERRSSLVTADQLLVIGRASVEGGLDRNRGLADRRGALAEQLLDEVLADARPMTRRWGLAHLHALAPERFQVDVREPPIAWTRAEADRLRTALARDLRTLPTETWQWVQFAINRVALVVPLYCDGTEYYPTPAYQGAEEVRKP